jgi:hypothetical protein
LSLLFEPSRPFRERLDVEAHLDDLASSKLAPLEALNKAYKNIFERNCGQGAESKRRAMMAFHWVLDAFEPLTFDRLAVFVSARTDGSLDPDFGPDELRQRCSNFLVDDRDGNVQFVHASASDFFSRYVDEDVLTGQFDPPTNHAKIAQTCLQMLLNGDTMREIVPLAIGEFSSMRRKGRWSKSASPKAWATTYIFLSWPYHARDAGRQVREEQMLSENMASFLVSPQNPWEGDLGVLVDLLENVLILSCEREALAFIFPILGPEFNIILPICAFGFLELLERPEISGQINFLQELPL